MTYPRNDYRGPAGTAGIIYMGLREALLFPMTYEQRKILYRGLYSAIVAKLYDNKKIREKNKKDPAVDLLIGAVKLLIDQAGRDYKAHFESKDTYGELENNYTELQGQILDKLWEITERTELVETITEDGVIMA